MVHLNHLLPLDRVPDRALPIALVLVCLMGNSPPALATPSGIFNILEYGAGGDGKELDTAAINKAIDACAGAGGGQVLFPPGRYLSGTVHLKSNVTLYLEAGAVLMGSTDLEGYQNFTPPKGMPESRWTRWHRALILGDHVENVAIAGPGMVDGNKVFDPKGEEKMRGPHTILLGISKNITIRDISIQDSANYAVMLEDCQRVDVRNVKFTGGWDGVHFRGWPGRPCRDVQIVGCRFFTGDDAVAGRYWENVLISGCILNSSCNGIRLIGPASHLIIHDCLFYGPGVHPHRTSGRHNMLAALNLQPGAWDPTEGGLDDVLISNLTIHNVTTPFHFTLKSGNTAGRITVSRVAATGVYHTASSVESWAETPFQNVIFRDVSIEFQGGGKMEKAGMPVRRVGLDARELPAWGFYVRNVKNLSLEDIRLSCVEEDQRPVMLCEGIERLTLDDFRYPRFLSAAGALVLDDVHQVDLRDGDVPAAAPRCIELKLIPEDAEKGFQQGKSFSVRAVVENGSQEGLGKVELTVAGKQSARWVWLLPHGKKEILFRKLAVPGPGNHEVRCGARTVPLAVEP